MMIKLFSPTKSLTFALLTPWLAVSLAVLPACGSEADKDDDKVSEGSQGKDSKGEATSPKDSDGGDKHNHEGSGQDETTNDESREDNSASSSSGEGGTSQNEGTLTGDFTGTTELPNLTDLLNSLDTGTWNLPSDIDLGSLDDFLDEIPTYPDTGGDINSDVIPPDA